MCLEIKSNAKRTRERLLSYYTFEVIVYFNFCERLLISARKLQKNEKKAQKTCIE